MQWAPLKLSISAPTAGYDHQVHKGKLMLLERVTATRFASCPPPGSCHLTYLGMPDYEVNVAVN